MHMVRKKKNIGHLHQALEGFNCILKGDFISVEIFENVLKRLDLEDLEKLYSSVNDLRKILAEEHIMILKQKNRIENKLSVLREVEKKIIYAVGKAKSKRCVFIKKVGYNSYTCKRFKDGVSIIRLRRYHCPYCKYALMSKEEAVVEEL